MPTVGHVALLYIFCGSFIIVNLSIHLFLYYLQSGLHCGNLLRFAIGGGLTFADGKLEKADIQYVGKSNRVRAFADSYSKVSWKIQFQQVMCLILYRR